MAEANNRTPENVLRTQCEALGLVYVGVEYGKRTYVYFICKKHSYKGKQRINREALVRWYNAGHCKCDIVHRDVEDLKREPTLNPDVEIFGEYILATQKVKCHCKKYGHEWMATPNKLKSGQGCPGCKSAKLAEKNRMPESEFIRRMEEMHPDLEVLSYTGVGHPLLFRCRRCGLEQKGTNAYRVLTSERGCSVCNASSGERSVAEFLENSGIIYKSQKTFPDCVSQKHRVLRFDFYLPAYNVCIEYQGEQHYRPVDFSGAKNGKAEKSFASLQERDNIKRQYCRSHHICLIEIPYWEKGQIETILANRLALSNNNTVETVMGEW